MLASHLSVTYLCTYKVIFVFDNHPKTNNLIPKNNNYEIKTTFSQSPLPYGSYQPCRGGNAVA